MAHMKLKRKRKKIKLIFILLFIYVIFAYTFYYSFKNNNISNEKFIIFLLNNGSSYMQRNDKLPNIVSQTMSYMLHIDFTNPESLFNENLIGYVKEQETDIKDINKLKEISYYMSDPNKVDVKNPIIYLYSSHQLENYDNYDLEIYGITPNVLMASYLLKEKLNEKGISTIVEDTNMSEFLSINKWDYFYSYRASRIFMLDKKNTYNSLKYYIDIHRDSVSRSITTTSINNKKYARILFVVGMEHANCQKNLAVMNEVNNMANKYYPGLSRGIYKIEGENVNGIYNQDISPNAMLIEVGGIDNNIDEVLNTVNALSDILAKYIGASNE